MIRKPSGVERLARLVAEVEHSGAQRLVEQLFERQADDRASDRSAEQQARRAVDHDDPILFVEQGERVADGVDRRDEVRVRAPVIALEPATLGDVADPSGHEQAARCADRRQADLYRDLAAVLVAPG